MNAVDDPGAGVGPIRVDTTPAHPAIRVTPVSQLLAEPVLNLAVSLPHAPPRQVSRVAGDVDGPVRYGGLPSEPHVVWGRLVYNDHGVIVRHPPVSLPTLHSYGPLPSIDTPSVRVAVLGPSKVQIPVPSLVSVAVHAMASCQDVSGADKGPSIA